MAMRRFHEAVLSSNFREENLKRYFIFCLLLFTAFGCAQLNVCGDDNSCTKVLFIGNSYMYVNDLPATFEKLAQAGGHKVETASSAEGGWTFFDHNNSSNTHNLIESGNWDYVVLQEQSQIPASEQARVQGMYPAARDLVRKIKATGATPVFFVTWAHRDGWPDNGLNSYEAMQKQIDFGYAQIAQELNVSLAPVGDAWLVATRQDPQLSLWQEDGSRPSEAGTYLAANVFYALIFNESPEGLSYRASLSKEVAEKLQSFAANTVLSIP